MAHTSVHNLICIDAILDLNKMKSKNKQQFERKMRKTRKTNAAIAWREPDSPAILQIININVWNYVKTIPNWTDGNKGA